MPEYKLPDPGEGLTEAEIVSWKVKVGDTVKINDVVVEIETAKSLVELPSPYAGEVTAILVPEGETVEVGTPIIRIGEAAPASGEAAPTTPAASSAEAPAAAPAAASAEAGEEEPMKTLVGYGPRTAEARRRPRKGSATPTSEAGAATQMQLQGAFTPGGAQSQPVVEADEPAVPARSARPAVHAETGEGSNVQVLAKPPVRKLAKDLGVDLRAVTPTGPNGTITREDVESLRGAAAPAAAETAAAAPVMARAGERERREPIKGVRKMMGQAMVESAFTAPHVTEWVTVDVTRTMRYVEKLRSHRDFRDVKVSPLLVVARACILAARRTPEVNATWDDAAGEVVFKNYVNLGIAAATPRGLVVPNVKDADQMSMVELARAISSLAATAREGRTQPAEMAGGSFTITNVGVFGVDAGTPIINPGESAILAFGAVRKQPWVHKNRIKVRDVTTLALSFDHRLVDGEKGSRFLADVAAILEDPAHALMF
ncbi:MAG TPA: dihydrolipoamide acetyltransferase family protein [Nocardioidaceae bacterium]|nr:dihydrolipoamide acetyltransferase family protein [Nocardioidaceae bacterium]